MSLAEYFSPLSEIEFPKITDLTNRFLRQADTVNPRVLPALQPFIPPAHWTTELMPFRGSYAPCYVSRAENENSFVGLVPGMSSYPLDWPEEIASMNARGISVVSLGLHQTKDYAAYYPVNRELINTFFLGAKRSPLYGLGDSDMARHAILHSTACPIFIDNLSEHGALERKPKSLSSATYLNPFMDTYDSSKYYHPYKNAIYAAFMMANPGKGIGTTLLEHWWMGDKDTDHLPNIYDRPENARVRKTRAHVRDLNREIWAGKRADTSSFPQTMYLGNEDYCICADTAQSIADTMGIEVQEFAGDHFSLMKSLEVQEHVTSNLFNIQERAKTRSQFAQPRPIDDKPERFEIALEDFAPLYGNPVLQGL